MHYEVINVSPGYCLMRNKEQVSVTLGDEIFNRRKGPQAKLTDKFSVPRTDVIADLQEQISSLTAVIEQMNRDHQEAEKLLAAEMDLRSAEMQQDFENKNRELNEAHAAELSELENNYKATLKAEKASAQAKIEEMAKDYKYLKNMFHMYQDSIYEEMEAKWTKKKAELERDERAEREKILQQQKYRIIRKFELESVEERKRLSESYIAAFENFSREKQELMKLHEKDTMQLEELRKTKKVIEEELQTQAHILETVNATLYQTQTELQREKAMLASLEKAFQAKLNEAEEKFKYSIQSLMEENVLLRQKIIAKNEEIFEEKSGRLTSLSTYEHNYSSAEEDDNKKQEP